MAWSIAGHTGAEWAAHAGSAVAFALLIPVLAVGRGAVSGALAMRPMVLLGEISYSLYLLHPLVLFILVRRFPARSIDSVLGEESFCGWALPVWRGFRGRAWRCRPVASFSKRGTTGLPTPREALLSSCVRPGVQNCTTRERMW
jgi:hypothetical protein